MVESVADAATEARLPGLQPLLSELPTLPIGIRDAGSLAQAHDVVEVLVLQPSEEAGPAKATIRQDQRPHARGQGFDHRQQRILLQLVLAALGWQAIPI